MPLTRKGTKIKASMVKEYGPKKGESVFYASEASGRIKGVAKHKTRKSPGMGYTDDSNTKQERMPRNYRLARMDAGKLHGPEGWP